MAGLRAAVLILGLLELGPARAESDTWYTKADAGGYYRSSRLIDEQDHFTGKRTIQAFGDRHNTAGAALVGGVVGLSFSAIYQKEAGKVGRYWITLRHSGLSSAVFGGCSETIWLVDGRTFRTAILGSIGDECRMTL